jgi:hypothetical protein
MKARSLALAALLVIAVAAVASAQATGEIVGKVSDGSGAVLPGVTVTVSGGTLVQPIVLTSSATGTFRAPGLAIGTYNMKFELAGFKTLLRNAVRLEIGATVQINAALEISTMQETVTVTGETPIVDLRDTGKNARLTQETLQSIPSARDPWVMIEQTPAVSMDRQNVGGSASGQQSNFVARGAAMSQQKWNLDGVDITDMNATGGSPVYYDFDSFEEMQITTGGADVTMMTPGVGINLVTKAGSDRYKGSARYFYTPEGLVANNVTDAMRTQGVSTGSPIQNIKDYGVEFGGPIKKGRAWVWGSYGVQKVQVGVNNFYKPDANCQAMKANPLNYSIDEIRTCLNPDLTELYGYNLKTGIALFKNNQFSFFLNMAEKLRNARDGSDTRPIETTYRQGSVGPEFGSRWWKTGIPKTYKWSDRQIFGDRLVMEFQYAHVGNNFTLDFHDPSLATVQPSYNSSTGVYGRSYLGQYIVRPTDSLDVTGNYFLPGFLGGDNSFKFGFKVRNDEAFTQTHYGGNAYAVSAVTTTASMPYATQAWIFRDGLTDYQLRNRSFYVQDSYTRKKLTVNAGFRFDYQHDMATAATVPEVPFYGQATGIFQTDPKQPNFGAYLGAGPVYNQQPSVTFSGYTATPTFNNFSPRFGLTYDLTGNSRNLLKFNYSRYIAQVGSGGLAGTYNPVKVIEVDYPWFDLNKDGFVQANEVSIAPAFGASNGYLFATSGYDPKNPSSLTTTGTVSPDLTAQTTNEFIVGFDKQLGPDFAVSASYIYRKYNNFSWSPRTGITSADYTALTFTPSAASCPAANNARCQTVTYYQPKAQLPTAFVTQNQPDYYRTYKGLELSARKRLSKSWMMNGSYVYNTSPQFYASSAAYQDPTNIVDTPTNASTLNGYQFAEQSTSSGLDNVFVNSKWIVRVSGLYQVKWQKIGIAGNYNARSGYPFEPYISVGRSNGAGSATLYLDPIGSNRLPTFQQFDMKVDKPFEFGRVKATVSMDVFNMFNNATTLSIRRQQNSTTANNIANIVAPRVFRFGVRLQF